MKSKNGLTNGRLRFHEPAYLVNSMHEMIRAGITESCPDRLIHLIMRNR